VTDIDAFKTDPTFDPAFADALTGAIQEMNDEGITPAITKGFRTAYEQAAIFANLARDHKAAVQSLHQAGNAVDFNSKDPNFGRIKDIMIKHGFVWGHQFGDDVHFQLAPAGTSPSYNAILKYGGDV